MRCIIVLLSIMALTVLVASCGGGGEGKSEAPKGTFDLPNGRSLYMECLGRARLP